MNAGPLAETETGKLMFLTRRTVAKTETVAITVSVLITGLFFR